MLPTSNELTTTNGEQPPMGFAASGSEDAGNTGAHPEQRDATFLIFRSQEALFAVPAVAVREVHALPEISPLEETAPFIVGVVNLRGFLVPVMDLAARFGHVSPGYALSDNLVVLRWEDSDLAVIVNEVRGVTRISTGQIEAPSSRSAWHSSLSQATSAAGMVAGVAKVDDDIVMLLHPARLMDWPGRSELSGTPILSAAEHPLALAFSAQWRPANGPEWTDAERAVLRTRAQRLRPVAQDEEKLEARVPIALVALGGERFGIALDAVREFGYARSVWPVPCCPPHILGQMNLRGDIVTLVDIRAALNTPDARPTAAGRSTINIPVVVVQHQDAPLGIVIDEVLDVLYLDEEDLTPMASPGGKYVSGGALHEGRLVSLLDLPRLFAEGGLVVDEVVS